MMNFIDIYTRLKLNIDEFIIVTYYSKYGKKETKQVKLIDIDAFNYILIQDENLKISIPFFGRDSIIKSICIKERNNQVYYNPYINDTNIEEYFQKNNYSEILRKKTLGDIDLKIEDRENFIQKYQKKINKVSLNDLFFSTKQKKEFDYFFNILIKELSEYCKKKNIDSSLNIIGAGTTSLVYNIGDVIIKIGKPRRNKNIPYCEYLLQPILNRDYEFDGYPIHIEITQKVITFDDVFENGKERYEFLDRKWDLFEKLKNIGLHVGDFLPSNVGILTKENKIDFDSIYFDVGDEESTSIKNNNNLKTNGKGELVILDLDCLEIEDIDKYVNYLRNIGYPEEKIEQIYISYKKENKVK